MVFLLFALMAVFSGGCQKRPALAPAADPFSTLSPPPMGATTYNDELKKELAVLEDVLNERFDPRQLDTVKQALIMGTTKGLKNDGSNEAYLSKVYLALPELVHPKSEFTPNKKLWFKAKLLFLRRRFIEAAMLMSEVLKNEPDWVMVRNWRARAIFFLGNPDLAIAELQKIVDTELERSEARLDALYLIGAIVYESNGLDPQRIQPGIKAWQKYLTLTDTDPQLKKEIDQGLKELALRLKGEQPKVASPSPDPFLPQEKYSAEKNAILQAFAQEELLLAAKLCDQALAKGSDRDVSVIKARIFIKSGRIDEAVALFDQIVEAHSAYAPGFHYRGMAFMMKGQVKEAIASWQQALNIDGAYARSHNLEQRMAVAQKMLGDEHQVPQ